MATVHKLNRASYLGVNAIGIEDFPINFLHTNASGTSSMKVSHGMQTHITKALEMILQKSNMIIITSSFMWTKQDAWKMKMSLKVERLLMSGSQSDKSEAHTRLYDTQL